jgi:hypothetical protein
MKFQSVLAVNGCISIKTEHLDFEAKFLKTPKNLCARP